MEDESDLNVSQMKEDTLLTKKVRSTGKNYNYHSNYDNED